MQAYNLDCSTQPDLITSHSSPLAMSFFNASNDPQSAHRPRRRALHAALAMLLATTGFALNIWSHRSQPAAGDSRRRTHSVAQQPVSVTDVAVMEADRADACRQTNADWALEPATAAVNCYTALHDINASQFRTTP